MRVTVDAVTVRIVLRLERGDVRDRLHVRVVRMRAAAARSAS
jgi:hypothetical protein